MATREITQIPDRFTGDTNIIRDDKVARATDATAASDITSQCEYLIKNGQTGEFMNVLKSYIDESIRSALGALVSNLDKGTSISKVLATDSSNDLGTITPANLASVLSANYHSKAMSPGHLLSSPDGNGVFSFRFSVSDAPSTAWGLLLQCSNAYANGSPNASFIKQLWFPDNEDSIYSRYFNGTQFSSWRKI